VRRLLVSGGLFLIFVLVCLFFLSMFPFVFALGDVLFLLSFFVLIACFHLTCFVVAFCSFMTYNYFAVN